MSTPPTPLFVEIGNDPRDYAWGRIDGVAEVLGRPGSGGPEAELWLGAHPGSPTRAVAGAPWPTLLGWERESGERLPFLLKILCAAGPLSLQAHPTPAQAAAGFADENERGIPLDAAHRNYKDPFAKPELIVALADGFEALCGFRPVAEILADVDALDARAAGSGSAALAPWRAVLAGSDGLRAGFSWLLAGGSAVDEAVAALVAAAGSDARFELVTRLAAAYPGDPGIAVALMLRHVTLAAGESLWLPAGNIHAYLRGCGVELMGPSDNVLRGGLTPKHVDVPELERVLTFAASDDDHLLPLVLPDGVHSYRPRIHTSGAEVPFELLAVTGDASVALAGPSIAIATDGSFALAAIGAAFEAPRGTAVFVTRATELRVTGSGRLWIATAG
ncbi:mannose-6-phosphate isomerase, class I [Microbacterium capsulatum]|uniref:mannose-6-phosphate isomerase n=1 Tax=Microbacterium capsulatum TaxID=3041921 RepID=A0ABU0XIF3_9MICO|nr:mannose-6-phosphate isomerase, class I [Microbacterium sp. ASV81]MDQ4214881.1 mannose-6-phosphate isomerase, class I [Microbacterium sp. ASV81]